MKQEIRKREEKIAMEPDCCMSIYNFRGRKFLSQYDSKKSLVLEKKC